MAEAVEIEQMGEPPAFRVRKIDDPVVAAALPVPQSGSGPGPGPVDVVLDLVAADVLPLDVQIAAGRFPPARPAPLQPGVSAVARRRDTGEVVAVQGGHAGMGFARAGTFASTFVAPAESLLAIPKGLDHRLVAAGLGPALTARLALCDIACVEAGETVLVLGANGGVGRACAQLARHLGATVVTAARDGADRTYDQLAGAGAHVIIDPVGGSILPAAILAGGSRCRHVFLGYSAGAAVELRLPLLMINEHRLMGFNEYAHPHDKFMSAAWAAIEDIEHGISVPVIAGIWPLAEASTAYATVGTGSGRVLLVP